MRKCYQKGQVCMHCKILVRRLVFLAYIYMLQLCTTLVPAPSVILLHCATIFPLEPMLQKTTEALPPKPPPLYHNQRTTQGLAGYYSKLTAYKGRHIFYMNFTLQGHTTPPHIWVCIINSILTSLDLKFKRTTRESYL